MAQASLAPFSNPAENSQPDLQEQREQQALCAQQQPSFAWWSQGTSGKILHHRVAAKHSMFEFMNPPSSPNTIGREKTPPPKPGPPPLSAAVKLQMIPVAPFLPQHGTTRAQVAPCSPEPRDTLFISKRNQASSFYVKIFPGTHKHHFLLHRGRKVTLSFGTQVKQTKTFQNS